MESFSLINYSNNTADSVTIHKVNQWVHPVGCEVIRGASEIRYGPGSSDKQCQVPGCWKALIAEEDIDDGENGTVYGNYNSVAPNNTQPKDWDISGHDVLVVEALAGPGTGADGFWTYFDSDSNLSIIHCGFDDSLNTCPGF